MGIRVTFRAETEYLLRYSDVSITLRLRDLECNCDDGEKDE